MDIKWTIMSSEELSDKILYSESIKYWNLLKLMYKTELPK